MIAKIVASNGTEFNMDFAKITKPTLAIRQVSICLPNNKVGSITSGSYHEPIVIVSSSVGTPAAWDDYQRLIDASPFCMQYTVGTQTLLLSGCYLMDEGDEFAPPVFYQSVQML